MSERHLLSLFSQFDANESETSDLVDAIGETYQVVERVSISGEPLEFAIIISGTPDEDAIVSLMRELLANIGFDRGDVSLSLCEVSDDDPDFEAPPWFEIDFKVEGAEKEVPAWMACVYTCIEDDDTVAGTPLSSEQLAKARSLIEARFPIISFCEISRLSSTSGFRVDYEACHSESEEEVRKVLCDVATELGVSVQKEEIVAYETTISV